MVLVWFGLALLLIWFLVRRATPPVNVARTRLFDSDGEISITSDDRGTMFHVGDGGTIRAMVQGKLVVLVSRPGEGPKSLYVPRDPV